MPLIMDFRIDRQLTSVKMKVIIIQPLVKHDPFPDFKKGIEVKQIKLCPGRTYASNI